MSTLFGGMLGKAEKEMKDRKRKIDDSVDEAAGKLQKSHHLPERNGGKDDGAAGAGRWQPQHLWRPSPP